MAKIQQDIIIVRVSRLLRDSDDQQPLITADINAALAEVAQELLGHGVIVEVESAPQDSDPQ